jgi:hypothetical protein
MWPADQSRSSNNDAIKRSRSSLRSVKAFAILFVLGVPLALGVIASSATSTFTRLFQPGKIGLHDQFVVTLKDIDLRATARLLWR